MIDETNQSDKQAKQRASEYQEDLERALKQMKAAFRLYYPEEVNSLESGVAPTADNSEAQNYTTGGVVRHRAIAKKAKVKRTKAKRAKASRARAELVLRGVEAISREVGNLPPESVDQLLRSSDPRLLAGIARASLDDTPIDRVERLKLKGTERFQQLIEDAGGAVSTRWVSEFFDTTEEAIRKRAQRGKLIARRTASGDLSFPRFQFDESRRRLLPGLSKLLTETAAWDTEELIRFLLVRHEPASSNDTPLKLLERDQIDQVLSLTRLHMQQRA
ncbi:hypothetical protein ACFIOZ_07370 [Vreelandella sp. F11]|uniref:hypothetical protein n=1 Tax=Vreelandella sp. F11 TaxID=3394751 RepID=UPI0036DC99BD